MKSRLAHSPVYSRRDHPGAFSLPQGGRQVLGPDLNCSELGASGRRGPSAQCGSTPSACGKVRSATVSVGAARRHWPAYLTGTTSGCRVSEIRKSIALARAVVFGFRMYAHSCWDWSQSPRLSSCAPHHPPVHEPMCLRARKRTQDPDGNALSLLLRVQVQRRR